MKIDWNKMDITTLAALVNERLKENEIDTLLVGGACVSVYTENRYMSYDLDFVTYASIKEIAQVLKELGFKREGSRHFIRKDCPLFIEFIPPPAAIGDEPVKKTASIKTKVGTVTLLSPTDCVKDRLAAFFHWNDPQALEQAVMVAKAQKVNMREDKRPDLPQVVIGLAVTKEGIPVRCWVLSGNTQDMKTVEMVKRDLKGWRLSRCIWVMDRGMNSEENRIVLQRAVYTWREAQGCLRQIQRGPVSGWQVQRGKRESEGEGGSDRGRRAQEAIYCGL